MKLQMTSSDLSTNKTPQLTDLIELIVAGQVAESSKRNYRQALTDFADWYQEGGLGLNRMTVQAYKDHLLARGLAANTINIRLAAVRALATEAYYAKYLDDRTLRGIKEVKNITSRGQKVGNWLTSAQARRLLDKPNTSDLRGLRNRAIIATFLFCALRRSEVVGLTVDQVRLISGRPAIVDIEGKHNRIRTVPLAHEAYQAITAWLRAAGVTEGFIFRSINRGGNVGKGRMTGQAAYNIIADYAHQLSLEIAPHDLRRTAARFMLDGGAPLDQISLVLGHATIRTTQIYLGLDLDLDNPATDAINF